MSQAEKLLTSRASARPAKPADQPLLAVVCFLFILSLLAPIARTQELSLRTMAGSPQPGAADGYGSNARFKRPNAVAADAAGNLYVADTENQLIRKVSPLGWTTLFAGSNGVAGTANGAGSDARFLLPQGITTDADGQIYVADTGNSTIRRISPAGLVSTVAGSSGLANSFDGSGAAAQFWHPEAIATGPDGNLYIADTWNHTIRKMTPAGTVTTLAGLAGNPGSINGTNSQARFNRPAAIAIDSLTNLFIADAFNHTVRKISAAGRVTTVAGLSGVFGGADGTNEAARLNLPQGVAVLANNDLLVSDSGNQTLRRVALQGTNWVVRTVAGLQGIAGANNGTGPDSRLFFPGQITTDQEGFTYVADTGNHFVRTTRVVPPLIQVFRSANLGVCSWPASAEGFSLWERDPAPDAAWSMITTGITLIGDNYFKTNSSDSPSRLLRLRFP